MRPGSLSHETAFEVQSPPIVLDPLNDGLIDRWTPLTNAVESRL